MRREIFPCSPHRWRVLGGPCVPAMFTSSWLLRFILLAVYLQCFHLLFCSQPILLAMCYFENIPFKYQDKWTIWIGRIWTSFISARCKRIFQFILQFTGCVQNGQQEDTVQLRTDDANVSLFTRKAIAISFWLISIVFIQWICLFLACFIWRHCFHLKWRA